MYQILSESAEFGQDMTKNIFTYLYLDMLYTVSQKVSLLFST